MFKLYIILSPTKGLLIHLPVEVSSRSPETNTSMVQTDHCVPYSGTDSKAPSLEPLLSMTSFECVGKKKSRIPLYSI